MNSSLYTRGSLSAWSGKPLQWLCTTFESTRAMHSNSISARVVAAFPSLEKWTYLTFLPTLRAARLNTSTMRGKLREPTYLGKSSR